MADESSPYRCRSDDALALVEGKWTLPVIARLKCGSTRFGALRRSIPGISQKALTAELKKLVPEKIASRTVIADAPILNVAYELTDFGHDVVGLLQELDVWARERLQGSIPG